MTRFSPRFSKTRLAAAATAAAAAFSLATPAHAVLTTYTNPTLWAAALTQTVTMIDFDDLADNTPLAAQYSGVSFSAFNGGNPLVVNYSFAQTGLNMVTLGTPPLTGGGGGVAMDFAAPMQGVGFWYIDSEFAGNGVAVFDTASGLLVNYEMAFPAPAAWQFVGFVSSSNDIGRIEVAIGAADMVALDSLRIAAVPEPASALLMVLGSLALVGVQRTRATTRQAVAARA